LFLVDGAIRFANYYQDHMVLQRAPERSIVWGYSDDFDTPITLSMNNNVYQTMSSSTSYADSMDASIWSVSLDPQTEEGPFQVKVTRPLANGTLETITLNDILFGDVWFCGGQSNMRFPVFEMFNGSVEIANANNYPKIRLFALVDTQASTPQEELIHTGMPWSVASNRTLTSGYVSAVCWLYGRMIHEALGGRPIGLTHVSWAGTYIEYWTPPEALKECGITG
jgi:sialate O-acetylesterase